MRGVNGQSICRRRDCAQRVALVLGSDLSAATATCVQRTIQAALKKQCVAAGGLALCDVHGYLVGGGNGNAILVPAALWTLHAPCTLPWVIAHIRVQCTHFRPSIPYRKFVIRTVIRARAVTATRTLRTGYWLLQSADHANLSKNIATTNSNNPKEGNVPRITIFLLRKYPLV